MNSMFIFGAVVGSTASGALVWFAKDTLTKMVVGTENFVKSLEAKVAGLKAVMSPTPAPAAPPPATK